MERITASEASRITQKSVMKKREEEEERRKKVEEDEKALEETKMKFAEEILKRIYKGIKYSAEGQQASYHAKIELDESLMIDDPPGLAASRLEFIKDCIVSQLSHDEYKCATGGLFRTETQTLAIDLFISWGK